MERRNTGSNVQGPATSRRAPAPGPLKPLNGSVGLGLRGGSQEQGRPAAAFRGVVEWEGELGQVVRMVVRRDWQWMRRRASRTSKRVLDARGAGYRSITVFAALEAEISLVTSCPKAVTYYSWNSTLGKEAWLRDVTVALYYSVLLACMTVDYIPATSTVELIRHVARETKGNMMALLTWTVVYTRECLELLDPTTAIHGEQEEGRIAARGRLRVSSAGISHQPSHAQVQKKEVRLRQRVRVPARFFRRISVITFPMSKAWIPSSDRPRRQAVVENTDSGGERERLDGSISYILAKLGVQHQYPELQCCLP
ncbi:hypothetical protein F5887DRAFT_1168432 [Amanita rubescens]|nr:hypothetical protein F5887DRAFT_1168432 [Amanita rubescens]